MASRLDSIQGQLARNAMQSAAITALLAQVQQRQEDRAKEDVQRPSHDGLTADRSSAHHHPQPSTLHQLGVQQQGGRVSYPQPKFDASSADAGSAGPAGSAGSVDTGRGALLAASKRRPQRSEASPDRGTKRHAAPLAHPSLIRHGYASQTTSHAGGNPSHIIVRDCGESSSQTLPSDIGVMHPEASATGTVGAVWSGPVMHGLTDGSGAIVDGSLLYSGGSNGGIIHYYELPNSFQAGSFHAEPPQIMTVVGVSGDCQTSAQLASSSLAYGPLIGDSMPVSSLVLVQGDSGAPATMAFPLPGLPAIQPHQYQHQLPVSAVLANGQEILVEALGGNLVMPFKVEADPSRMPTLGPDTEAGLSAVESDDESSQNVSSGMVVHFNQAKAQQIKTVRERLALVD